MASAATSVATPVAAEQADPQQREQQPPSSSHKASRGSRRRLPFGAASQSLERVPSFGQGGLSSSRTPQKGTATVSELTPQRDDDEHNNGANSDDGEEDDALLQLLMRARSPTPVDTGDGGDEDAAGRHVVPPVAVVAAASSPTDADASASATSGFSTPRGRSTSASATIASGGGGSAARALRRAESGASVSGLADAAPQPAAEPAAPIDIPPDMRCPVCLDAFRSPVTLSCYHNVCKGHVLDLAAARTAGPSEPRDAVTLACPKCRKETSFPSASEVPVNTEMQAIVDMMVGMLRLHQQQQTQQATVPSAPRTPKSGSGSPRPMQRRHSSGRLGRVRFADEPEVVVVGGDDDDGDRAAEAAGSSAKSTPRNGIALPSAVRSNASRHERARAAAVAESRLTDLEKQLEEKRKAMLLERERRNREATEEFKRMRMQEIRARQAVQDAIARDTVAAADDPLLRKPVALRMAEGEQVPQGERLATTQELQFKAQEAAFLAAKRARDEAKEREREAREQEVRVALQGWLDEQRNAPGGGGRAAAVAEETEEFARRMQQALRGRPLTESVKRDAMREVAESRLPPMPSPPPQPLPEHGRGRGAPSPSMQRMLETPMRDVEVELRMLEAERAVQREVDEELSRAQMAEIAERRARDEVARFRRREKANQPWSRPATGTYEPPPPPGPGGAAGATGYTPKLSRLRRFV